jgi:hypothetical protein
MFRNGESITSEPTDHRHVDPSAQGPAPKSNHRTSAAPLRTGEQRNRQGRGRRQRVFGLALAAPTYPDWRPSARSRSPRNNRTFSAMSELLIVTGIALGIVVIGGCSEKSAAPAPTSADTRPVSPNNRTADTSQHAAVAPAPTSDGGPTSTVVASPTSTKASIAPDPMMTRTDFVSRFGASYCSGAAYGPLHTLFGDRYSSPSLDSFGLGHASDQPNRATAVCYQDDPKLDAPRGAPGVYLQIVWTTPATSDRRQWNPTEESCIPATVTEAKIESVTAHYCAETGAYSYAVAEMDYGPGVVIILAGHPTAGGSRDWFTALAGLAASLPLRNAAVSTTQAGHITTGSKGQYPTMQAAEDAFQAENPHGAPDSSVTVNGDTVRYWKLNVNPSDFFPSESDAFGNLNQVLGHIANALNGDAPNGDPVEAYVLGGSSQIAVFTALRHSGWRIVLSPKSPHEVSREDGSEPSITVEMVLEVVWVGTGKTGPQPANLNATFRLAPYAVNGLGRWIITDIASFGGGE